MHKAELRDVKGRRVSFVGIPDYQNKAGDGKPVKYVTFCAEFYILLEVDNSLPIYAKVYRLTAGARPVVVEKWGM